MLCRSSTYHVQFRKYRRTKFCVHLFESRCIVKWIFTRYYHTAVIDILICSNNIQTWTAQLLRNEVYVFQPPAANKLHHNGWRSTSTLHLLRTNHHGITGQPIHCDTTENQCCQTEIYPLSLLLHLAFWRFIEYYTPTNIQIIYYILVLNLLH